MEHSSAKKKIVIVGSNPRPIGRFREIFNSLSFHKEIRISRTASEAIAIVENGTSIDLVVILNSIGEAAILEFLEKAETARAERPFGIIVALDKDAGVSTCRIAELYVRGVGGFVVEPLSASELDQLVQLVFRQTRNAVDQSMVVRKASSFVAAEAARLLDEVALSTHRAQPRKAGAQSTLKELSEELERLYTRDQAAYEDALAARFATSRPFADFEKAPSKSAVPTVQHPGIRASAIVTEREIPFDQIVTVLQWDRTEVERLFRGELDLDDTRADALSRAVGHSPRDWLKWQSEYDRYRSK